MARVLGASAAITVLLCALTAIMPSDAAQARLDSARTPTTASVPVAAVFQYHASQDSSQGVIHGAIHAVVRIPGGTAVFYSVGGPGVSSGDVMPSIGLGTPYSAFSAWAVGIVDTKHLKYYMPLSPARGECLCSRVGDIADIPAPTKPLVGWAVLPKIPRSLTHVTIQFGFGTLIANVPVTSRLPQPAVASGWQEQGLDTTRIPLGTGWPKLPPTSVITAVDAGPSIRSLAQNTANSKEATKETPDSSSISVNSNVLFAFNESTLTPQANDVLTDVATKLSQAGAGTASIVGYTDDVGGDDFNLTLSQARAQSVLAALQKLVAGHRITFTASGLGEQSPVADNGTPEGRQLNRRVTITFAKAGS